MQELNPKQPLYQQSPRASAAQPAVYAIRIKGQLDSRWSQWFDDLSILQAEGDDTVSTGPVTDQAAWHGILS